MTTATRNLTTVSVMDYASGMTIGVTRISIDHLAKYEAKRHPIYQWPEGIARAGHVLSSAEIERLGISPDTTIWLD